MIKKVAGLFVAEQVVDRVHYHNRACILIVNFGLIAVAVLAGHIPDVELNLTFDIVHFHIH